MVSPIGLDIDRGLSQREGGGNTHFRLATFCSANCTKIGPFGGFMVPPISIPQVHLLPYSELGQLRVHGDVNRTYSTDLFWSPSQLYPTELEPWQEQLVTGRRSRYLCRCEQNHFNFTRDF